MYSNVIDEINRAYVICHRTGIANHRLRLGTNLSCKYRQLRWSPKSRGNDFGVSCSCGGGHRWGSFGHNWVDHDNFRYSKGPSRSRTDKLGPGMIEHLTKPTRRNPKVSRYDYQIRFKLNKRFHSPVNKSTTTQSRFLEASGVTARTRLA